MNLIRCIRHRYSFAYFVAKNSFYEKQSINCVALISLDLCNFDTKRQQVCFQVVEHPLQHTNKPNIKENLEFLF